MRHKTPCCGSCGADAVHDGEKIEIRGPWTILNHVSEVSPRSVEISEILNAALIPAPVPSYSGETFNSAECYTVFTTFKNSNYVTKFVDVYHF